MSVFILGSYAKALAISAEHVPLPGETMLGHDFRQTFGGKGADMAIQAVRLGADVYYAGVIGEDSFGQEFYSLMREEGVEISGVSSTSDQPTGVGIIIRSGGAKRIIVVDMGANSLFTPELLDASAKNMKDCSVVVAQLEIPLETALHGMACGKAMGKTTILNPAPPCDLSNVDLSNIDFITPNEIEARLLLGLALDDPRDNWEIADMLLEKGCSCVIMTLGERGALLASKEKRAEYPAFKVDAVDTSGCGDSFNAALAVALDEEMDLDEAIPFANATAALSCTDRDTVPAYKTRGAVEQLLGEDS